MFLWLGVRTWRSGPVDLARVTAHRELFLKSCFVAAVNPKTLLFNAAFLPQFMPIEATATDVALVASVFLLVLFAGDVVWALCASAAKPLLRRVSGAANRVAGGFLVIAAIGLALARRNASA